MSSFSCPSVYRAVSAPPPHPWKGGNKSQELVDSIPGNVLGNIALAFNAMSEIAFHEKFLGIVPFSCLEPCKFQNCLQWGQSNLVDPAGSPKIRLLNRDLGTFCRFFPG